MERARLNVLSVENYLAMEQAGEVRYEYVAGQVFAMVGSSDVHNTVALNIASRLRDKLRGGPCRVYISDMKLRVERAEAFYYPDVFVTCDPRDTEAYYKRFPVLVVEVLSPATEAVDRREKLRNYRMLETMKEYVLIATDERKVEIFRREPDGDWLVEKLAENDPVTFYSVGLRLSITEVYENTGPTTG